MHVVGGSSPQDSITDTNEQMSAPREPHEFPSTIPTCAALGPAGDLLEAAEALAGDGELTP
jgi:hypothetical protein